MGFSPHSTSEKIVIHSQPQSGSEPAQTHEAGQGRRPTPASKTPVISIMK